MQSFQIFLALGMVITGSINTISTKLADMQCVPDNRLAIKPAACFEKSVGQCSDGCRQFNHPFAQAGGMFIGELLCIFAFYIGNIFVCCATTRPKETPKNSTESLPLVNPTFPPYIFAVPALLDMLGTCTMYAGLTMTHASVFQMLRGSVVVFTGVLSVTFLGRSLQLHHWAGMLLVTCGAFIVGLSSVIARPEASAIQPSNPFVGNILVVLAQVIVALQMVTEERFLKSYEVHPLQAVGWEGLWGLGFLAATLGVAYHVPYGPDRCGAVGEGAGWSCLENVPAAAREVAGSSGLALAVVGNLLSVSLFNFCGVSVTKSLSATHRMVLDSVRTMAIWVVSLALGWQTFEILQVVGFAVLLSGTLVYNQLLRLPCLPTSPAPPSLTPVDWPEALTSPFLREADEGGEAAGPRPSGGGGRR